MITMKQKSDYILLDKHCKAAVDEFKVTSSVTGWMSRYAELFNIVNIQPAGLPMITDAYFDDEQFDNIILFSDLYNTLLTVFD